MDVCMYAYIHNRYASANAGEELAAAAAAAAASN
jgi:hypothetical protein